MTTESHSSLMFLAGGMAIFMYGMKIASDYLQKLAANKTRSLMAKLSEKRILAVLVGVALTALLQSSGAVTSMLVGLGTAKVISLPQVMGVIVGTAIGSTLTVQLISFNISQYGLGIFFFSFMVFLLQTKRVIKNIAAVFMGFGLIFFGLELMAYGTIVFKSNPLLIEQIRHLSENPLLAIIVTSAFTAFIHSSSAVIGLAMSLAMGQVITVMDAMYWVYGANIGTTSTALMAAINANYIGKQVAWAHFFYKVGSVLIMYFATEPFVSFVCGASPNYARCIANLHTFFNVISAVMFFPFINVGSRAMEKLIPKSAGDQEFSTKFIHSETYNTPALALAHAQREILRMGDIVLSMVRDSMDLFKGENPELVDSIRERDNQVDLLNREIKLFLVKFETGSTVGVAKNVLQMIDFCSDIEAAADVVDKGICELSRKKQALKLDFSPQGWTELCDFHKTVVEIVSLSLSAAHLNDAELAKQVIEKKRKLRVKEKELRESHLFRLNQGLKESINTSSIHMDLLSELRHCVSLIVNHAYNLNH